MRFKNTFQVLGCKGFKGTVEGTSYDSTTLYVVMDVSEKNGTEAGFNVSSMKFGKESEFQKLKGLPFPVMAELDIELTTKGPECLGFKVISQSAPKPQASA
jgi:hypothetical protein